MIRIDVSLLGQTFTLSCRKDEVDALREAVDYLNKKMNIIHRCKYNVKKKVIPDIGNFLVLLLFCNKKI